MLPLWNLQHRPNACFNLNRFKCLYTIRSHEDTLVECLISSDLPKIGTTTSLISISLGAATKGEGDPECKVAAAVAQVANLQERSQVPPC